jgi:hypothetical protein
MNTDTIIFILVGLVIVFAIIYSYFGKRTWQNAWSELASHLGLECNPGSFLKNPFVVGTYRGRNLTLDSFTRGTSKNRTTYTRIVMSVNNPTQLSMKIYQETIFSKVGKMLGGQDIQVGDEQLDQRYVIKGQPETDVIKVLSSISLRQKLLQDRTFNFD